MFLTTADIAKATNGQLIQGCPNALISSYSSDTRSIHRGDAFIALKGPNFNGEDFIPAALENGAAAIVASNWPESLTDKYSETAFIKISDSLLAMGEVARVIRSGFSGKVAMIAGSSGKTTVKEIIAHAVDHMRIPVLATDKNFNNLIGLPATIFKIEREHEIVVLEAGMNEPGELERLTQITQPDVALLTNVGVAHLGKFGSHDALVSAKSDMWRNCGSNCTFVVNADCSVSRSILQEIGRTNQIITFGVENLADVTIRDIRKAHPYGYHFSICVDGKRHPAHLAMPGRFNVENAAAMVAGVLALGLPIDDAISSLELFHPRDMRCVVKAVEGINFIVDCYNCSPDGMQGAVRGLAEVECSGRRVAVLGDMLELGDAEDFFHEQVGAMSELAHVDAIFTLGDRAKAIIHRAQTNDHFMGSSASFDSKDDLLKQLIDFIQVGDCVLFKASRLMRFENLVETLTAKLSSQPQIV